MKHYSLFLFNFYPINDRFWTSCIFIVIQEKSISFYSVFRVLNNQNNIRLHSSILNVVWIVGGMIYHFLSRLQCLPYISYILLHQKAHIEKYFSKNLCNKNKLYSLYQYKQGLSGNSMKRRNNSIGNLYIGFQPFSIQIYQCTRYEEGERL